MPEKTRNLDAIGKALVVGLPHPAARSPEEANDNRPANHVQRVEAG